MKDELPIYAKIYAEQYELPYDLVLAMIDVESSNNTYAFRMEPHYRYLVDVRNNSPFRELTANEGRQDKAPEDFPYLLGVCSRDSEWMGQQSSWGAMQVMGAVAREHGFQGHFPQLCNPNFGIKYGCKHLRRYKNIYFEKYGWKGVVAAYNAGSVRFNKDCQLVNQHYVDKVSLAGARALFQQCGKELAP